MKKIRELFQQLQTILSEPTDLKTAQELCLLAKQTAYIAKNRLICEQQEYLKNIDFFKDANATDPLSFGQCGDHVYWKVIDGVLYVDGSGPMWDFDNILAGSDPNQGCSPWKDADFNVVMIGRGVTAIGADAFHGAHISNVLIPDTVKTIRDSAFFDARIHTLILPETLETIEEGIITGFVRVVDTLAVSANIPNMEPFSLFNRDDAVAANVILTGKCPSDLQMIVESRLFDDVGRYNVHYPADWDTEQGPFYERLLPYFPDAGSLFLKNLKSALIPHEFTQAPDSIEY